MRTLTVKGERIASVRVRAGESAQEKYAGAELAKYLEKLGIPAGDGLTIDIGIDPELPKEKYVIRPGAGEITIRGGSGRGAIYGAYGLLTHYAGVRFFMPGLEKLGEGEFAVDEEYSFEPGIARRESDWPFAAGDPDWCVKNCLNHRRLPEEMGGYEKGALFCHSMEQLAGVPQDRQPCLSDPEVLKTVIRNVRHVLETRPNTPAISVTQNDNDHYCTCPKCAAIDAEEGSHAGTMIRFVNAVADDIAADYPDVLLLTFAYQYTRKAPKITKPRPNVAIRLCSIECCRSHPLTDRSCPRNEAFLRDYEEWSRICSRIYIWDYTTNFAHYIAPFPNFGILRENMRYFAEHSAYSMYPEGNYNSTRSGEFGELRCWLLAQLMRDPYMSTTEYYGLMDEFLEAYYGAGWRYIRAFIDWTCAEAANGHMGSAEHPFACVAEDRYRAMEETIDGWWDKAEEMAGERLEHVQRSRLQWRYVQFILHPTREEGERLTADLVRWDIMVAETTDWTYLYGYLNIHFDEA